MNQKTGKLFTEKHSPNQAMQKSFTLISQIFGIALHSLAVTPDQLTSAHLLYLAQHGIPQTSIIGVDADGVPRVCGTGLEPGANLVSSETNATLSLLPAGMRSWECIPGVIRNDGIESFRLEVDVNGPVFKVTWDSFTDYLVAESGTNNVRLRDDGLGGDRVAGDRIYTSENMRYRVQVSMPSHQGSTTNSISGIYMSYSGHVRVEETNTAISRFLTPPHVAILSTNVPVVATVMLASNIQASAHVLNVVTTNREAQRSLRTGSSLGTISQRIYPVMPDAFDFLSFFTTDHIEYRPFDTSANFTVGRHFRARVNYTGTGLGMFDSGLAFGSTNRLLGLNVFDTTARGISDSTNPTHEYLHQWASHTAASLNLSSGGHYSYACSVYSLLGGFNAIVTNGTIVRNCSVPYAPHEAAPLDKYLMGLIDGASVPTIYASTNSPIVNCDFALAGVKEVTITNIQAIHGVRSPGPATAKRDFRIGFVTSSHNRLLNATEMTFYDVMAAFYTKPIPPEAPTPGLSEGWVPIARYFGESTTWSADMLTLIQPKITKVELLTNGVARVMGTGYPVRNHRLMGTTNFLNWTTITNGITATNGSLTLHDSSQPRPSTRYYRVTTP